MKKVKIVIVVIFAFATILFFGCSKEKPTVSSTTVTTAVNNSPAQEALLLKLKTFSSSYVSTHHRNEKSWLETCFIEQ
jgi:hypothetical protein